MNVNNVEKPSGIIKVGKPHVRTQCKQGEKAYRCHSSLEMHERTHTGGKPHECVGMWKSLQMLPEFSNT